ncbi:uncharacterized protein EV154DRAFT_482866 [Mucor mucedo]|uniref:uncharacterized protein n=1 Tax=Mucor mucedo TaxID=29922 RepID=UPI0022202532|nr:uncharacterized protein EV154DRAFT_482866 [Mucor mucedo]KAI7889750.1 hypothetical protein EV154DRAFT_482866 [Mucor mucedo]
MSMSFHDMARSKKICIFGISRVGRSFKLVNLLRWAHDFNVSLWFITSGGKATGIKLIAELVTCEHNVQQWSISIDILLSPIIKAVRRIVVYLSKIHALEKYVRWKPYPCHRSNLGIAYMSSPFGTCQLLEVAERMIYNLSILQHKCNLSLTLKCKYGHRIAWQPGKQSLMVSIKINFSHSCCIYKNTVQKDIDIRASIPAKKKNI